MKALVRPVILRILGLVPGCVIVAFGIYLIHQVTKFRSELDGHYRQSLDALSATIQDVDQTVSLLQRDTGTFDTYLVTLRKELKDIGSSVDSSRKQLTDLTRLTGTTTPKTLDEGAAVLTEASKVTRKTADQIGRIPGSLFADQRKSLYTISGTLKGTSNTLKLLSTEVGGMIRDVAMTADGSLNSASIVLQATDDSLATLQGGALKRLPATLATLSEQLQTHLSMIRTSYDLVERFATPAIMFGRGLIVIGASMILWQLLSPRARVVKLSRT